MADRRGGNRLRRVRRGSADAAHDGAPRRPVRRLGQDADGGRLVHFPAGEHEDLNAVWLWTERVGLFSHETAFAVALSGYGMDEDIRCSREAGFEEHLTKPVDLARLKSVLARF
jgi:CheY-like chemotaxis protein